MPSAIATSSATVLAEPCSEPAIREMVAELTEIAAGIGRPVRQRSTTYEPLETVSPSRTGSDSSP